MHDLGKTAIPVAVLNKPGPLDDADARPIRAWGLRATEAVTSSTSCPAAVASTGRPSRASQTCVQARQLLSRLFSDARLGRPGGVTLRNVSVHGSGFPRDPGPQGCFGQGHPA